MNITHPFIGFPRNDLAAAIVKFAVAVWVLTALAVVASITILLAIPTMSRFAALSTSDRPPGSLTQKLISEARTDYGTAAISETLKQHVARHAPVLPFGERLPSVRLTDFTSEHKGIAVIKEKELANARRQEPEVVRR